MQPNAAGTKHKRPECKMSENVVHLRWPPSAWLLTFWLHLHFDNCSRNRAVGRAADWCMHQGCGSCFRLRCNCNSDCSCKGIKTDDLCRCLMRNGNRSHYTRVPMVQFRFFIFHCSLLSHIKMHEMRQLATTTRTNISEYLHIYCIFKCRYTDWQKPYRRGLNKEAKKSSANGTYE